MAKTLKIKLIDRDKLLFALAEDGTVGDLINLTAVQTIDFSNLTQTIDQIDHEWKSNVLNQALNQAKTQWELAQKQLLLEQENRWQLQTKQLENQYDKEINEWKTKYLLLEQNQRDAIQKYLTSDANYLANQKAIQDRYEQTIATLKNSQQQTLTDIAVLKEQQAQVAQKAVQDFKNDPRSDYGQLLTSYQELYGKNQKQTEQLNLKSLENQHALASLKAEMEKQLQALQNSHELAKQKLQADHELNIQRLHKEHEQALSDMKNMFTTRSKQSKLVGEEYELAVQNAFHNSGLLTNGLYELTKETSRGQKSSYADFLFTIRNQAGQLLEKIVIEAKATEKTDSKIKNESFFKKLHENRKQAQAKFALLVTNLEPEHEFLIYQVADPNYPNMFVLRLECLIPFLSLLISWVEKNASLIPVDVAVANKYDYNQIQANFDIFMQNTVYSFISEVSQTVQDLQNYAISIGKKSESMVKLCTKIMQKILVKMQKEIKAFHLLTN